MPSMYSSLDALNMALQLQKRPYDNVVLMVKFENWNNDKTSDKKEVLLAFIKLLHTLHKQEGRNDFFDSFRVLALKPHDDQHNVENELNQYVFEDFPIKAINGDNLLVVKETKGIGKNAKYSYEVS